MNVHHITPPPAKPIFEIPVPARLRTLIDESLNFTLEEIYADRFMGAFGKCADYAIVGARVLSKLLDQPYVPVAGGEIIDCGDGMFIVLFPSRTSRRNARNLSELMEFHCWIQSFHAVPDRKPRLELVDFTVRHDRDSAHALNVGFTRQPEENYLWDWSEELDREIPPAVRDHPALRGRRKGWMWTDRACTRLLLKYEKENDAFFGKLTALVLNRLADKLESSAKEGGVGDYK